MTRGKRKPLAAVGWRDKAQVYGTLTAREVCNGWHVHYSTVMRAIHAGNIVARKSGKTWLISHRSVKKWWGMALEDRIHIDES